MQKSENDNQSDKPTSIRLPSEEEQALRQQVDELVQLFGKKGISKAKYIRAALIEFHKKSPDKRAKMIRTLY